MTKIVCISDTHCKFQFLTIPECDILISAGDYSFKGTINEVANFHRWLEQQPAKHIVSVQGNHEVGVQNNFGLSKAVAEHGCPRVNFVDEGLVEVEGLKIYCSAITPFFHNWAWNRHPGEDIQKHWDRIPSEIDVLVTHGPCYGILDSVRDHDYLKGEYLRHCGCPQLLEKVKEIKPKYHIFGHIHDSYGQRMEHGVNFVNASICDESYEPTNKPIIIEI
jgi:Icc-related predicted phosphoesterase